MNIETVEALIALLEGSSLQKLEVSDHAFSFKAEKKVSAFPGQGDQVVPIAMQIDSSDLEPEANIKAPLVGTLYLAPGPEQDPFVALGDYVNKGDTLCIIEAMKVMNEITAPHSGVVESILCQDGEVVGFDQPLMLLGKDHV